MKSSAELEGRGSSRTIVLHVDDLGASHGANSAFGELAARGLVTCGSVMVPGPWFREVVDMTSASPSLDIGIHLTLTSEWDTCRWAPISTVSRSSGLIDAEGYFWRDLVRLRRHLVLEAAEAELRAQIDRAVAAGIQPTHIDAHMGAAMLPELLDAHVRLAREYGLVPVLPRSITWAPDRAAYAAVVDALDRGRAPVFDHCRGTLPVSRDKLEDGWWRMLTELPPGMTHFALHCTKPGGFEAMAPAHALWRYGEYKLLASGFVRERCEALKIAVTGTRTMHQQWGAYLASKG